jgi:hypothetical protein
MTCRFDMLRTEGFKGDTVTYSTLIKIAMKVCRTLHTKLFVLYWVVMGIGGSILSFRFHSGCVPYGHG